MIRYLLAASFGGLVSTILLTTTGSARFAGWIGFFIGSTIVLILAATFGYFRKKAKRLRLVIAEAEQNGRVRAALILSRRQTGTFVNERPEIEFTLLVDRPGERPFVTHARKAVDLIDLHTISVGELIAVAHPDPEYGEVYILDEPSIPAASEELEIESAETADSLPAREPNGSKAVVIAVLASFVAGLVGTPFLAAPQPFRYVEYLFADDASTVAHLDHPVLFDANELERALHALTAARGSDEVFSVAIRQVQLVAEVPGTDGAVRSDRITVRDHQIVSEDAGNVTDDGSREEVFRLSDVDWAAVLKGIPEAERVAVNQGIQQPVLDAFDVRRNPVNLGMVEIQARFSDEFGSQSVTLQPDGELAPAERFAMLSETEQTNYLYDPERFMAAAEETLEVIGGDEMIRIVNHGDRLLMEAYPYNALGVVEAQFREGSVRHLGEPTPVREQPVGLFKMVDADWGAVFAGIAEGQRLMGEAGAPDTVPTHIIIERSPLLRSDPDVVTARVYLSNSRQEGGYVVVNADGSIGRVQGP